MVAKVIDWSLREANNSLGLTEIVNQIKLLRNLRCCLDDDDGLKENIIGIII